MVATIYVWFTKTEDRVIGIMTDKELADVWLEQIGEPKMIRMRFDIEGPDGEPGYMEASVPVGSDPEEVKAEMLRWSKAADDFAALSEVDKLKYYLANAYEALNKIMMQKVDVGEIDWSNETEKKYAMAVSDMRCIADMACCVIPTQYRSTEIKIGG